MQQVLPERACVRTEAKPHKRFGGWFAAATPEGNTQKEKQNEPGKQNGKLNLQNNR